MDTTQLAMFPPYLATVRFVDMPAITERLRTAWWYVAIDNEHGVLYSPAHETDPKAFGEAVSRATTSYV